MGDTDVPCRPGDKIGKYTVLSLFGRAAMGDAYLASLSAIDRRAVIMVLAQVEPALDRGMRREAALIAKLHHPNIPTLYDIGEFDGRPYLVFEYVEGRDLTQLIATGNRIPVLVTLRMMATVAGALQYAHGKGVLHKDLSPRNIVIGPSGEPVLCGFWFSAPAVADPNMRDGIVLETLAYSSPEQASHKPPTPQSDIWRLGATMLHALTGAPPFTARSSWEMVEQITSREPVDVSRLDAAVPEYVASIVSRCLLRRPEGRYQSAEEMRKALDAAIDHIEMVESDTVDMALPRQGQTILLHVECREAGMTGSYREFEIGPRMGGGAFADVYRATEKLSGTGVALKILKRDWLGDQDTVARFRREATLLTRLTHPNIVSVHNFGRYGASFFMSMDLLEGPTLAEVIRQTSPMDVDTAVSCIVPVLEGLAAVHEAGVVHRDLKPDNVAFVGESPVVFDFNTAHVEDMTQLTSYGMLIGTPDYMSPEQAACTAVSGASDVYAAGVILYEMLTGRLPYEEKSRDKLVEKITSTPPAPITKRRSDLPPRITSTVSMMLARDPEARPTPQEAARLLAEVRQ